MERLGFPFSESFEQPRFGATTQVVTPVQTGVHAPPPLDSRSEAGMTVAGSFVLSYAKVSFHGNDGSMGLRHKLRKGLLEGEEALRPDK